MLSRFHNNNGGFGRRLIFFKYLCEYSTNASLAQPQTHFLVGRLESLLGFSKEEAISTAKKVTLWKSSSKDPSLVINFFEKLGLDKTQIRSIVSSDPRLLVYDVDKTLKPKIRVLQEFGLSGSNLNKLILCNKKMLSKGVDPGIRHPLELLRKLLGSDENVAKALKRNAQLLDSSKLKYVELNFGILKKLGISKEKIVRFILRYPRRVMFEPEWLEEMMHRVENEFGIPRESKMFYYGLDVISSLKNLTIEEKFVTFRSYGFSDAHIYSMFRIFPDVLSKSKAKVRGTVNFVVKELGCTRDYLASHPVLFALSLEKRMRPRYEILKVLEEKKLIRRKPSFCYLFYKAEREFLSSFVLPYKDEVPDMYESYIKSVERLKIR